MKIVKRIGRRRSHMIPAFSGPVPSCPIPLEQIAIHQYLARRAAHPLGQVFCLSHSRTRPLLIVLVGPSGTGKSTIAREWAKAFGSATVFEQDSTLIEYAMRPGPGLRAKYDFTLANEIVVALMQFQQYKFRPYSPVTHLRQDDPTILLPHPVILVEGILALEIPVVRMFADVKYYVECDPAIRFAREFARAKSDGRYCSLLDAELGDKILSKRIDEDPMILGQRKLCQFFIKSDSFPPTLQPLSSVPNRQLARGSFVSSINLPAMTTRPRN